MWRFYSPRPVSVLEGVWAALSGALAHALLRRRLPAAVLTGALVSLWPRVERRLYEQRVYHRLSMRYYKLIERLYRFRYRLDQEAFERDREQTIADYGYDPMSPPAPLQTLRRVISIGQTQRIENGTLMLLSLEDYAEGGIIHCRLLLDEESEQPNPFDPNAAPGMPTPELGMRDDLGKRYPVMMGGGGGGGSEYEWEFRVYQPLDPRAHDLTLEVTEINRESFGSSHGRPSRETMQAGSWTFIVRL